MDEAREQSERDYQLASGLSQDVETDDNVVRQTSARLPWLLIGMVGGIANSMLLGNFDSTFAAHPEMALYIPLIGGTGGNVGTQSSAIVVQGLANSSMDTKNTLKQIAKESVVAIINATIISLLVYTYNVIRYGAAATVSYSVSISLFAVVMFASIFGTLVPLTLEKLKIDPVRILGAGIAMPGLIEKDTGKLILAPDFGWKDIPLQDWLQAGVPYPVLVKNSTQALAVNESHALGTEEVNTTFCVNLGYGIGAAIITGETLYESAVGISGELGHCVIDRDGPLCKCGNRGCLEAVSSGEAIARQAQTIISHHARSKIAELCGGNASLIDAKMVFEAAKAGDESALKIINYAAVNIGIGLSSAVNILDPDRVVICGGLMQNDPAFLDKIKAGMEERLVAKLNRSILLTAGTMDEYSTAMGASRVFTNTLWAKRALPI
jgi:predicted NBD/HSP70 family sugar kinase